MNINMHSKKEKLSVQEFINRLQFGLEFDNEEDISKNEAKIRSKLEKGKPLTSKEIAFLRKYNKELYIAAIKVEIKRKCLENRISRAKSKEEVLDIQLMTFASIRKDDTAKKYIVAAIDETMKEFKETHYYKNLPATNEEAKLKEKPRCVYQFSTGKNSYQMAYEVENTTFNFDSLYDKI